VVCEGNPGGAIQGKHADHDARCYEAIFGDEKPDVKFVSGGNSTGVAGDNLGFAKAIPAIVSGTSVIRLIDRDDHASRDVADFKTRGITVLSQRHIESFLWDDEVLTELCNAHGASGEIANVIADKAAAIASSQTRGNPAYDIKSAAGAIYNSVRQRLGIVGGGNDARSFARNSLAPLIKPGMRIYAELDTSIFGP
jgi:hypothetical protein